MKLKRLNQLPDETIDALYAVTLSLDDEWDEGGLPREEKIANMFTSEYSVIRKLVTNLNEVNKDLRTLRKENAEMKVKLDDKYEATLSLLDEI